LGTKGPRAIEDINGSLDKLWRIDIDGQLELEIDMVHKMFKRKNI
jgi:hypothetical protein